MSREKSKIVGVLVPGEVLDEKHWIDEIKKKYEAPDEYGKSKIVEFETIDNKELGTHYVNYWVY